MRFKIVKVTLSSYARPFEMKVDCLVVNRPPARHPAVEFNRHDQSHLRGLVLADDKPGSDNPIDILLGADALRQCLRSDPIVQPDVRGPSAISTQFGYVLVGHVSKPIIGQVEFEPACPVSAEDETAAPPRGGGGLG